MRANPTGNQGVSAYHFSESTTPLIATAAGTVATLTAGQVLVLQNLAAEALFVRLGAAASPTVFHFVLPACTAAKDGTSPPIYIDNWTGIVSVAPASAASYMANVLKA